MLAKCKHAIEELHFELEYERKSKADLEQLISRLESEGVEKGRVIQEFSQRNADLQGNLSKTSRRHIILHY